MGISPPPTRFTPASRRDFLRISAAGVGGAFLNACAWEAPAEPSPQSGGVQLVYQDWRTEWFVPMAQEMLGIFHTEHPDMHVYYVPDPPSEAFGEKKLADFQSGTAPDVFQGCCSHFPIWAQKGYALDLRPYVVADLDQATIADWDPAQYRAFFADDGRQYGLPKYHGALALYFNKDLFDQYSIDYPDGSWDHEDYRAAMQRLTHDLDGDGEPDQWGSTIDVSWDRVQIHVNGWGGRFVDPADPTRCMMGEQEALAALEWLRACIWDERVMVPLTVLQRPGTHEAFLRQRVAMLEDGSWSLKDILAGASFRLGVAPFPSGPARKVTLATTDGFGIYAGTKHPDQAWELLKFLIGEEYGLAMARANFLQPARASLVDEWVGYIREQFPEKTEDVDIAAFADGHIRGYSVVAEVFDNMTDATRIAQEAWDKILTLGQEPVDSMMHACRLIQESQTADG
ncbi:MAG TPA: sugar ABC transporter substrate-binding protein [Anaerolineales bacterium]|nr:sugar ABC transporter substrate-binding protein [Anaerolineales bacterium]